MNFYVLESDNSTKPGRPSPTNENHLIILNARRQTNQQQTRPPIPNKQKSPNYSKCAAPDHPTTNQAAHTKQTTPQNDFRIF